MDVTLGNCFKSVGRFTFFSCISLECITISLTYHFFSEDNTQLSEKYKLGASILGFCLLESLASYDCQAQ